MTRLRRGLNILIVLVGTAACGVILGDEQHWFPGPILRAGAWLALGCALGYGAHRIQVHDRRDDRRDRRDVRDGPEPKR